MAPTRSDLEGATEEFVCQLDIAVPDASAYPGVGYLHGPAVHPSRSYSLMHCSFQHDVAASREAAAY